MERILKIIGYGQVKKELIEFYGMVKDKEKYEKLGVRLPLKMRGMHLFNFISELDKLASRTHNLGNIHRAQCFADRNKRIWCKNQGYKKKIIKI